MARTPSILRPMTRDEKASSTKATPRSTERSDRAVVREALSILTKYMVKAPVFYDATTTSEYLRLQLGAEDVEKFGVMFMNAQGCLIKFEIMALGTLNQCLVYPREIARRALELNALRVILAHNHPSGSSYPSASDIELTKTIAAAMKIFDIHLADHIIVARGGATSLAELGLV